jgi:glycosyltransferase involved in cell wall biosynthesis
MYEGVEVMPPTGRVDAFEWADVICTHLDYTQFTILMAHTAKRPLVHFIHNDIEYSSIVNAQSGNNIVYNSQWIADKLKYRHPSIVLHPPCDVSQYNVCENPEENEFITLISLNVNKGGNIFYQLAEAMPHKKFLGVRGSYDEQIIKDLPNVTIVPNTPDILSIYKKTRVLLMPSAYESWGRTATEAMCSGIPVICTPTPGLKENCGEAAVYVPRRKRGIEDEGGNVNHDDLDYDIEPIVKAINKLDDKGFYQKKSEQCRERAKQLSPENELQQVEQFIYNAQQSYRH